MTIKEQSEKLHKAFIDAWDNYKKIEQSRATSTGLKELLSTPELKKAYQQWQYAVSAYYDFARQHENKLLTDEYKDK